MACHKTFFFMEKKWIKNVIKIETTNQVKKIRESHMLIEIKSELLNFYQPNRNFH